MVPAESSKAAQIAAALPGSRVVKAFNTIGFDVMADPRFPEGAASLLLAGDDARLGIGDDRGVGGRALAQFDIGAAGHQHRAAAVQHSLVDPAGDPVGVADAPPDVVFGDHLDGQAAADIDPLDLVPGRGAFAQIDLARFQADIARHRQAGIADAGFRAFLRLYGGEHGGRRVRRPGGRRCRNGNRLQRRFGHRLWRRGGGREPRESGGETRCLQNGGDARHGLHSVKRTPRCAAAVPFWLDPSLLDDATCASLRCAAAVNATLIARACFAARRGFATGGVSALAAGVIP